MTAVAAIRPSAVNVFLAAKRNAAVPTTAAAYGNAGVVNE
jgi:hypothetical protein